MPKRNKNRMFSSFDYSTMLVSFGITTFLIGLTNLQIAIYVLLVALVLDFLTGVYASFVESIKESRALGESVSGFREKLEHLMFVTIESEKLRKSILKSIAYLMIIFLVYFAEVIFFIEESPIVADQGSLSSTLYAVGFCVAIESYSILFENLKRAGFDLSKKISKTTDGIKENWLKIKNLFKEL